jgi:Ran GTPase-activating protein (RanGAP) involved in mRNA processing and transport
VSIGCTDQRIFVHFSDFLVVVELDFSENEIGPSGALVLARAIKESNNIRVLNLADCKLKAKGEVSRILFPFHAINIL